MQLNSGSQNEVILDQRIQCQSLFESRERATAQCYRGCYEVRDRNEMGAMPLQAKEPRRKSGIYFLSFPQNLPKDKLNSDNLASCTGRKLFCFVLSWFSLSLKCSNFLTFGVILTPQMVNSALFSATFPVAFSLGVL